jgi:murein DD-endopeptidase MepM/ murein hydrolase activator NlpD
MAISRSHAGSTALVLFCALIVAGCSAEATPTPPAPSVAASAAPTLPPGAYVVKSGDTLITVAAGLAVSQDQLVAWNKANHPNIASNPELHAGDLLWTAGPAAGIPAIADPATAKAAESWIDGAWYVYQVALPPETQALGTLESGAGASQPPASASGAAGSTTPAAAVALINAHQAWMAANAVPTCLADGYAADTELANAYLWWLNGWKPLGGAKTIIGAAYLASLQVIDANRDTFLKGTYLADCA